MAKIWNAKLVVTDRDYTSGRDGLGGSVSSLDFMSFCAIGMSLSTCRRALCFLLSTFKVEKPDSHKEVVSVTPYSSLFFLTP